MKMIKMLIFFTISVSLTACAPPKLPEMKLSSEYEKFAVCPKEKCRVNSNDSYIAIAADRKIIDVYSIETLKKVDQVDWKTLYKKYGINYYIPAYYSNSVVGEIKEGTAYFTIRGSRENYQLNLPGEYQKLLAAEKVSGGKMAVSALNKDKLDLLVFDLNQSGRFVKKIQTLTVPYTSTGAAVVKNLFDALTGRAVAPWHHYSKLQYDSRLDRLYFGISAIKNERTGDSNYQDAQSYLYVYGKDGETLVKDHREKDKNFIDYGRMTVTKKGIFIYDERARDAFFINPLTLTKSPGENLVNLFTWNRNAFVYTQDYKNFYVQKMK